MLGAGASHASVFKLPVMRGFFVNALERRPELAEFLAWYYPGLPLTEYDLEEVLAFLTLSDARLQRWGLAERIPAHFESERLLTAVLSVVREQLRIKLDPLCPLHLRLLESLTPRDSIISLNYDVIVDRVLWKLEEKIREGPHSRAGRLGKVETLLGDLTYFGQSPPGIMSVTGEYGFYLKLHGSLNWVACQTEGCGNSRRFHISSLGTEVENPFHGQPCMLCGSVLETGIVPPVAAKRVEDKGRLATLWNIALRELSEANEIVIVGLSLAPSDFELRWLLRQAVQLRKDRPVRVVTVNPHEEHRARLRRVTDGPHSTFTEFDFIDDYLERGLG
jgi:hypothetical protein